MALALSLPSLYAHANMRMRVEKRGNKGVHASLREASVKCQVSSVFVSSCFNIILPLSGAHPPPVFFGGLWIFFFGSTDTSGSARQLAMLRAEQTLLL